MSRQDDKIISWWVGTSLGGLTYHNEMTRFSHGGEGAFFYRPNFLLGGMTFKHETPPLISNYATENKYYRKHYAGTLMLFFTENHFQFLASYIYVSWHNKFGAVLTVPLKF